MAQEGVRRLRVLMGVVAALMLLGGTVTAINLGQSDATLVARDDAADGTGGDQAAATGARLRAEDLVCPATDGFRYGVHGDSPLSVYATPEEAWQASKQGMAPHLLPSTSDFRISYLVPGTAAQLVYTLPLNDKPGFLVNAVWGVSALGEGPGWSISQVSGCSSLLKPVVEKNLRERDAEGSPEHMP